MGSQALAAGAVAPALYLCGSITQDPRTVEWRREVAAALADTEIVILDPCRGKDPKDWSVGGLEGVNVPYEQGGYVARDFSDIRRSRAVLAYWPSDPGRQSVGTWMELGYCVGIGVPFVFVNEDHANPVSPGWHPFVYKNAARVFHDLRSGLAYVRYLFA